MLCLSSNWARLVQAIDAGRLVMATRELNFVLDALAGALDNEREAGREHGHGLGDRALDRAVQAVRGRTPSTTPPSL